MLKKIKCLETAATVADSCNQTLSVAGSNSNSKSSTSRSLSYIKLIKTEPIDLEMAYVDACEIKECRIDNILESNATNKLSETPAKPLASPTIHNQHVQIQTVPPRQPGAGLVSNANTMQKIILTPRLDFAQRPTSTSDMESEIGTIIRHVNLQQANTRNQSQQQQQQSFSSTNAHISQRVSQSLQSDSISGPQIIITRSLPVAATSNGPIQRRHSASPSNYHRTTPVMSSSNNVDSPPPSHQLQRQYTSNCSPQPSPPPLSLQNHVRVIRDGRLYEESTSGSILVPHNSVSPPPLLHHHQSRSAPTSPILPRRYSASPHDTLPSSQSQSSSIEQHDGRLQRVINNEKQQIHICDASAQYHRHILHSPPLPPPTAPPPPHQSLSAIAAVAGHNQAMIKPSLMATNQHQSFVISPSTRKYVVTTNTRQSGTIPVTSSPRQLQHSNYTQHKNQQPQRHHPSQHQQEDNCSSQSVSATPGSMGTLPRNFRIPVVTSNRCNNSSNHDPHLHSQSNTAMRPPPPPPPKTKSIASTSVSLSNTCNAGSSSVNCPSNEEPSSSIPDLEFDGTTVLCRVCGDKASGFHYGVHSCEGCKGFFRRSIQQKIQYRPCTKNQQCSILRINRNRCQYCRLKKCIAVGMSRDAVRFGRVPKREKARILAAMQQSTQNRGQQRALAGELDDQPRLIAAVLRAHLETCEFTKEKVATMRQRARECPSYSMPTLLACPLNPAPELQSEQEFSQRFAHVIRGVIDFAGMIPGFQLLTQDDKFTLLKAGLFDALFVRLICMFDSSINSIICLNGQVMRRDAIQNGANARFLVDSTFNFAERMNSMNLSDAEIGLFCAIVLITPDRPGLRNIELIEKMYSRLKGCLQKVISQNRADQPDFMSKLLDTMPDLRTLSTLHTEKLVVFRTEHKELLRQQMWTMDDERPVGSRSPIINWDDPRMDVEAKSPLGSVSSTESGDLEYNTSSTTLISHQHINQQGPQQPSALASSAPLLAATLSGSCPIRNRANSGSSGDSTAEMDIVGSHAHLTQNGLTITPIVRSHSHQQLHHHLTSGTPNRYRKLDSPTDSGIESGNEKNDCGIKAVSSGGSSSCSSPRSSVDDTTDCTDTVAASTSQVTISVSPIRSPQPIAPTSTSSSAPANTQNTLKRQIVEDMPVLKRVLQAPPLYDTNSLMDEAYKPHKKFRALRHREFETAETDPSSTSNGSNSAGKFNSTNNQTNNSVQSLQVIPATNSPPPSVQTAAVVSQSVAPPSISPNPRSPSANGGNLAQQSQLQIHLTRQGIPNICSNGNGNQNNNGIIQPQQQSSLSSTHSVLAKSLMAEPRMTPEQIKRSDIIQNYIMRDSTSTCSGSLITGTLTAPGSRSPAPIQHLSPLNQNSLHYNPNGSPSSSNSPACSSTNCASPSTTIITLASPSPPTNIGPIATRWQGHSVITTTSITQRQQSDSPSSNGSASSSSNSCQYFQSPHSTSTSVSSPRPSPSAMHTPPRILELQVDIADSQQPLNLSKKSPTPPPSKMQTLVAAATAVQRYPNVSTDVTVTPTSSEPQQPVTTVPVNSTQQLQVHKVMLEA